MSLIKNPHDKFFKEVFGDLDTTKDFIINYLPKDLINVANLNTLSLEKDSYIEKDLKETFSDLLFKVNLNDNEGFIYFLFEHKSYPSKKVKLQLLKYVIKIWEQKTQKSNLLPIVIPLVIYHGKKNWNVSLKMSDEIEGFNKLPKDLIKYIPNFEYLLFDFSKFSNEDIKGNVVLKIMIKILRDIFTKNEDEFLKTIVESLRALDRLENQDTGTEYIETLIRYLMSGRDDLNYEKMKDIVEEISMEGSEVIMSIAEKLGQEGRQEALEKTAIEALKQGADIEFVSRITGLSKEKLEKMASEINT